MSKQVRLYCGLALATTMCSVAFGLYQRDVAFQESHMSGVLYYQNTDLKHYVNELEGKLADARRQKDECQGKR